MSIDPLVLNAAIYGYRQSYERLRDLIHDEFAAGTVIDIPLHGLAIVVENLGNPIDLVNCRIECGDVKLIHVREVNETKVGPHRWPLWIIQHKRAKGKKQQ